jgi:uncharacterized protein (DUF433 family)
VIFVFDSGRRFAGGGGARRRFEVCPLEQPSSPSSQTAAGFLQLFWTADCADYAEAGGGGDTGLRSRATGRIMWSMDRKAKADGARRRIELGRHIVADPKICGGQPTFKGTRIMVWIVLEQLDRGLTWQEVVREWDSRVSEEAIGEAIAIAGLVVKHEPFGGFHVGAGRKSARPREAVAA